MRAETGDELVRSDEEIYEFPGELDCADPRSTAEPWKMLVADDFDDVHAVTKLALGNLTFEGRPLEIMSAYSGAQAKLMMAEHPDVAVLLLDVVMESEHSGLDVVRHVRDILGNGLVRVILRTGQAGVVPERSVIVDYDINDYKEKSELTTDKLFTCVISGLRGYRGLKYLDDHRRRLAQAQEELRLAYVHQEALVRQRTEQLIQTEKLASLGQLAAGVAHEINNPMGYVLSNICVLDGYVRDLFRVLDMGEACQMEDGAALDGLRRLKQEVDLDGLREDIPVLMRETKEGISRVHQIVRDLRDFSQIDCIEAWQWTDLQKNLDATINVMRSELERKAELVKEYGDLPPIECLPRQLNQVFMNLLRNAAQSMDDGERGRITVRTGRDSDKVWVEVSDTGCGIPPDSLPHLFDPFFTTKPVGQGTGLGLSLSYGAVRTHAGDIAVSSDVGTGSIFRVTLPIRRQTRLRDGGAPCSGG